jgi:16S rRNA (guanine1207-N2)-methyltransferase
MRSARLEMALETGALVVATASVQICVLRPRIGDVLSMFDRDQVTVRTGFRPDYDHFAAMGYRVTGDGPFDLVIVGVPRSKTESRALIAQAAALLVPGGQIILDGQKTDGIETAIKDCAALGLQVSASLSKAHGKLAIVTPQPVLGSWAGHHTTVEGGFVTAPGVFSADGPDRASVLLAAALPAKLPSYIADLGAGWGYLSRAILTRATVTRLDLVEAEATALDCARSNISDPRAQFHWADATSFKPKTFWNAVVMNPPFHVTRDADASLGARFIAAAQRGLSPGGTLWMVANRHLPYDKVLAPLFREVEDLGGDKSFRLTRASYPVRAR